MNQRELQEMEDHVHYRLAAMLEDEQLPAFEASRADVNLLRSKAERILSEEGVLLPAYQTRSLISRVIQRMTGFGPLEELLEDETISEIMVNDPAHVFVERNGTIEPAVIRFRDEAQVRHVIERIVAPIGRRIDESSPLVDARLPDGSRVNAIIPPLAIRGPALTIRKFSQEPFTLKRLVESGSLDREAARYLHACILERRSLVISGGTGSGKTTMLNALSLSIPSGERIITIEDSAELRLCHHDLVSLEARPPNLEGRGEITIRTLVRNALRMRPDRIVVGEVRGGEAFDMLQAMNTGHRGSLTTLHANNAEDALVRLESMVLMAGFDMPLEAIRRMISGALDVIVYLERLPDGRRILQSIHQLDGLLESDYQLRMVCRYQTADDVWRLYA